MTLWVILWVFTAVGRQITRQSELVWTRTGEASWRLQVCLPRLWFPVSLGWEYHWYFDGGRQLRQRVPLRPGNNRVEKNEQGPRGLYRGPAGALAVRDPFGWFVHRRWADGTAEMVLVPDPLPDSPSPPESRLPGESSPLSGRKLPKDDRFDARPYYPGDDVRHLHWKLLAHTGELVLRTSEPAPPPRDRIVFLLDTWIPDFLDPWTTLDAGVRLLWTMVTNCGSDGFPLRVYLPGEVWNSEEGTEKLRHAAAALHSGQQGDFSPAAWADGLFVLGTPESPRLSAHGDQLRQKGATWLEPAEWVIE